MFSFFLDGTSRHIAYFDQLKKDEGYAGMAEWIVRAGEKWLSGLSDNALRDMIKLGMAASLVHYVMLYPAP